MCQSYKRQWEWQLPRAEEAFKQGACFIMHYKIENIEIDI